MTNPEDQEPGQGDLPTHFERLVRLTGGPSKAARALDVSRTTLDQWIRGKTRIPLEPTVRLARLTGASLDEIVLGRDQPPPAPQDHVKLAPGEPVPEGFVAVPMLDVRVSAGSGLVNASQGQSELVSFRADWLRAMGISPGRVEALLVVGDSMAPTVKDGDMILVDRQIDRVIDGALYVIVVSGEVRVKRVLVRTDGSLVLKSDNPIYGEETVAKDRVADLTIEGRVRWFGRTI